MKRILKLALVAVALASLCGSSTAEDKSASKLSGDQQRGKALYRRYCQGCHGVRGDGLGENAAYLDPKPRDFTAGTFKCRSTPTGSIPTDEDLYSTISRGLHASGMPSWQPLTRQQRMDLIAYVKTFSPRFREEHPAAGVQIPAEPAKSAQSIQRGAELFQKMNCWSCHGKEGRGNGPSAGQLTDSKGFPIMPYDFTSATRFKCGEHDEDLFRVLVTGLDGTPMPSFADALKPAQVWDLVHFVQTFRQQRKPGMVTSQPAATAAGEGGSGGNQ